MKPLTSQETVFHEPKDKVRCFRLSTRQNEYYNSLSKLTGITFSRLAQIAIEDYVSKHIIICDACEQPMLYRDKQIRGALKVTCKQCGYTQTVEVE